MPPHTAEARNGRFDGWLAPERAAGAGLREARCTTRIRRVSPKTHRRHREVTNLSSPYVAFQQVPNVLSARLASRLPSRPRWRTPLPICRCRPERQLWHLR